LEEQLKELRVTSSAQILALQERNSALDRKIREQVCTKGSVVAVSVHTRAAGRHHSLFAPNLPQKSRFDCRLARGVLSIDQMLVGRETSFEQ
jgi:hypothetical protein